MTSVGSILRETRESQGRAIAAIAEELCITQRYLRAIEENDVTGVPGLFFYKNFARQYAALLGIEEGLYRVALNALTEPENPLPQPEIRVPDRLVQAANRRYIPDISMGWSVAGLVLVLLVCSGFYSWWKRIPQAPAAAAVVAPLAPMVAVKDAALPVQVQTESHLADPSLTRVGQRAAALF